MITLEQIGQKLNRILNGITTDSADTGESWLTGTFPTTNEYNFAVKTNGFHLDKINENNKNLVFVFVDSLGGEINNVKSLKEIDYNTEITFYYPVRFKDDFYSINNFLYDTFVEQFLNFGTSANKDICLTAISVAQYGEIGVDNFQQLATFINNNYPLQKPVLKSEMYMSMTFTLYLSTVNGLNQSNGLLFGNSWNTTIKMTGDDTYISSIHTSISIGSATTEQDISLTINNPIKEITDFEIENGTWVTEPYITIESGVTKIKGRVAKIGTGIVRVNCSIYYNGNYFFTDTTPLFINETNISNSEPIAEQVLGEHNSKGLPVSTAYTKELPIYIKNDNDYKRLVRLYLNRNLENITVEITESNSVLLPNETFTKNYYITNLSMVKAKGEMLGITLTLAERLD